MIIIMIKIMTMIMMIIRVEEGGQERVELLDYIKCKKFRRDKLSDKDLSENLFVRNLELSESFSR